MDEQNQVTNPPEQATEDVTQPIRLNPEPVLTESQPQPSNIPNYAPVMNRPTNTLAIVSLVASILSWIGLFGIGGVVGVITGVLARKEIKASNGAQDGDSLALTGIILGGVNIALACLGILCVVGLVAAGIASDNFR